MQTILSGFLHAPLLEAAKNFYHKLGIPISEMTAKPFTPQQMLQENYNADNEAHALIENIYALGVVNDDAFARTLEIFAEEVTVQNLAAQKKDYDGLLLLAVNLKARKNNIFPSRSQLAEITRVLNRKFPALPVTVIFNYPGSKYIALANAERTAYKSSSREGEKAGKVSLLMDVKTEDTHSGHMRILQGLAINTSEVKQIKTFKALYEHWRTELSLQTLNKRFYKDIFHWYLWARQYISLPPIPKQETQSEETLLSIFTIRLLTRLLFVWFVKEKGLMPGAAFNPLVLKNLVKNFDPEGETDKMPGNWYKAVLQNLFFATLNTPMDADADKKTDRRQFIDAAQTGYTDDYMDQTKYRHANLLKDPAGLVKLFEKVPFLNGGLFECLDTKTTEGAEIRYDGFSGKTKNQPDVPDFLFFCSDDEADFSEEFSETKKKKIEKVKGLINTLEAYKFTVAENTPLEEEIALDPELLGKVFENLLASYNPETKTTARKQTGSFYTPREIVSYMTDESLKAYLLQKLSDAPAAYLQVGKAQADMFGNKARKGQLKIETEVKNIPGEKQKKTWEVDLTTLFSDAERENPFGTAETELIMQALSECKILDPACGSGAFPMGILLRMVNLLNKLDPKNIAWKKAQLAKAEADRKLAEKNNDDTLREKAIQSAEERIMYINESFEKTKTEFDFTRKLFLIENCIYGVDIQTIAVQISKLRFFISLMAEQQTNDSLPNRGILSMPNLETKFVAGNTLVGLEKPNIQMALYAKPEVKIAEKALSDIRRSLFYVRRWRDKKKLRKEEAAAREKLKNILTTADYTPDTARKMSEWDPFDQMHAAPFFDTETMFGFGAGEGFDVVIGNPPYGLLQEKNEKEALKAIFKTLHFKINKFACFIEKGVYLTSPNGILTFIIPNLLFGNDSFKLLRKFLCEETSIKFLMNLGDSVFENVTMPTMVFLLRNIQEPQNTFLIYPEISNQELVGSSYEYSQHAVLSNYNYVFETTNPINKLLLAKINNSDFLLADTLSINQGIITGNDKAFLSEEKKSNVWKPTLRGRDIGAYQTIYPTLYVKYSTKELACPRSLDLFEINEKIVLRRTGDFPVASLDNMATFNLHTLYSCRLKNTKFTLRFLLALLNSKLIRFAYHQKLGTEAGRIFAEIKIVYLRQLPIKLPKSQAPFITFVDTIITKKKAGEDTSKEEAKIDQLVYELYGLTEEEIAVIEGR